MPARSWTAVFELGSEASVATTSAARFGDRDGDPESLVPDDRPGPRPRDR